MRDVLRRTGIGVAAVLALAITNGSEGQIVYTGLEYSFTKPNFADFELPENQDCLTSTVCLTRAELQGLFNISQEIGFSSTSPQDTEWATYLNNLAEPISAANYANLTFEPWIEAYGGAGGSDLPMRLTGGDAVLHLISDDIYLDVRFTSWASARDGGGGGFSYLRSVIPEPQAILLSLPAVLGLSFFGARRHR
jgi:hypothetical protein